ncbi:universal stress protein [Nonomuraea lactucae]|uniref:universal stress protein n=1 Tax=Nonomuraea lactucae TaxID=2249762 RepID=UPI000DE416BA|nr:universal stress protein [Nonomuraea lactucae]
MTEPIVVGFDGSESSLRAVGWAGREAGIRDAPLHIVHAAPSWSIDTLLVPEPPGWEVEGEAAARQRLKEAEIHARVGRPRLEVSTRIVAGPAGDVLVQEGEGAQLLVVGSRGRGGFAELLLGSVSRHVATRAPCPVGVVRQPPADERGAVVVGVTGRSGQEALLDFAFREAALRRAVLRAVHAWTHPGTVTPWSVDPAVYDIETVGQEEALLLAQVLAGWRGRFPDVEVVQQVVHEHPAKALTDASAEADVVVVGASHGASQALLGLGGTAHAVLHHARAPVIVVRGRPAGMRP